MKSKKSKIFFGVLSFGMATLMLALTPFMGVRSASADGCGEYDYEYLLNPFGGGSLTARSEADDQSVNIDIPMTYSLDFPTEYDYQILDYANTILATYFVGDDVTGNGNSSVLFNSDDFLWDRYLLSYRNKVFLPRWYMNTDGPDPVYPCMLFQDDYTIAVRGTFVIPNSKVAEDEDTISNSTRFRTVEFTLSSEWLPNIAYSSGAYGITLSSILNTVLLYEPDLKSSNNTIYANSLDISWVDGDYVRFINEGNSGDTFGYSILSPEVQSLVVQEFFALETYVVVNDGPLDQILAVPRSFLNTEFLPNFKFGDLLLILLGVIVFGFVLKSFLGG